MSDVRSQSKGGKYVIFCVGQEDERVNEFRDFAKSTRLVCKELRGSYKGKQEVSFITPEDVYRKIDHWTVEEESVLILHEAMHDGARPAMLEYGGRAVPAGMFRQCGQKEAESNDSWTLDPTTGCYYICK